MLFDEADAKEQPRIFPSGDPVDQDEREFWDSVAEEPARLSGATVAYFSLRRAKGRHPLYREPSQDSTWTFDGPFALPVGLEFMSADSIQPEVRETGIMRMSDAVLWIARREFERVGAPDPKEGDVVEFWSVAIDDNAFATADVLAQWDVVKANPDGQLFSQATFVQWKLEIQRRETFTAMRKTAGNRP